MIASEKVKYSAKECIDAFCEKMNERAQKYGMTDTLFRDPCGVNNTSSASDIMRLLVQASAYTELYGIWGAPSHIVDVAGKNARKQEVVSTVVSAPDSHVLYDSYKIVGGKTGTLSRYSAFNLAVITEDADKNRYACAILYADEPNGSEKNRFEAARSAMEAALKGKGEACAQSASVCRLPRELERGQVPTLSTLYEKGAHIQCQPASTSKLMTAILTLECFEDLDTELEFTEELISVIPAGFFGKDFFDGDKISLRDAFYAMLLPSSNVCAYLLAQYTGRAFLEAKENK